MSTTTTTLFSVVVIVVEATMVNYVLKMYKTRNSLRLCVRVTQSVSHKLNS